MNNVSITYLLNNSRDRLFYLACLLITFNIFPFERYGMGASKSLSVIPAILYTIQGFFQQRLCIPKYFNKQIYCLILLLSISFFISIFRYNDLSGFRTAIGIWGSYFIIMSSFFIFLSEADDDDIYNMLRCVLYSFRFSFFFGILEAIYFNVVANDAIKQFIMLFVRDGMYLNGQRLQLNFGEPSDAGGLLPGLLFPVIIALKNIGYNFKIIDKIVICGNIILVILFSQSTSFVVVSLFTIIVFYDNKLSKNKLYKFLKYSIIMSIVLFGGATIIFMLQSLDVTEGGIGRFISLISDPENALSNDQSSATRFGLWVASFDIYKDNIIFGTGLGNFGYEFKNHFDNLDPLLQTPEMYAKTKTVTHQTYSIFSTAFVEGGLLGIFWLFLFLKRLFSWCKDVRPYAMVFIIIAFQNMVVYSFTFCFIYVMLTEESIYKSLISRDDLYEEY